MGYLESAVVMYMRELVYPEGFSFPLKPVKFTIVHTELFREAATLLMLLGVGMLAGRTTLERFGMFLFSFAIWDMSYYLFLHLITDWPASIFTWDILFFIPDIWTGPVIAPLILSLVMIAYSVMFSIGVTKNTRAKLKPNEVVSMSLSVILLIGTFMLDYMIFVTNEVALLSYSALNKYERSAYVLSYIPDQFNYLLFSLGVLGLLLPLLTFYQREIIQP
jgi:hypothetical protein